MIEELKSATDQLRTAWENYCQILSTFQTGPTQRNIPHAYHFPQELSRQLGTQLDFLSSYELEIREIKLAIKRAHNYSHGLAPINSLPLEILTRIFHLARVWPCGLDHLSSRNKKYYPSYPHYLAQVCALWRRIAISSRLLWCHIDLSSDETYFRHLIAQAETNVARTGGSPLELHITNSASGKFEWPHYTYEQLYDLVSHVSYHVESFELVVFGDFRGFHRSAFSRLLLSQSPTLTKLVLSSHHYHFNSFIYAMEFDPSELDDDIMDFALDLATDQIEAAFAPITVLYVRGIFPLWTSVAYSGLVDLRLTSTDEWSKIQEISLIAILQSSPGLRILHFGLKIHNLSTNAEQMPPVYLQDLQVIKIFPNNGETTALCPGSVLRLLAPGSKPLRLSFGSEHIPDAITMIGFEKFLLRAKVERFYARTTFPQMQTLLRHAPHLELVVFDDFGPYSRSKLDSTWLAVNGLDLGQRLKHFHLTRSTLFEGELRSMVSCCPTGLVLYSCCVGPDSGGETPGFSPKELVEAFPTVRVTEYALYPAKDPTADWDILD
ncbi:unnamed protein product [Rhizoctonia solani]|uniref:F-box-like domain protein n=1 Tax=Rhizoctonia solani TaxID=456999 RepID=A0A8H3AB32_9AGAM|nr:unnamed protein product [Rhizoctonia solani]